MTKLDDMTIDELDDETIRLKTEQPAKVKDKLRAVKSVRDIKVHIERTRDRLKKILINAAGRDPDEVDEYLKDMPVDEIMNLIKPFEEIEDKMGVVATLDTGTTELKGQ